MTQQLFREEALQAQRTNWLGGISLTQPIRLWVLTSAAVAAAIAIALFLIIGTYTQRSRVVGQLVPARGLATVVAPSAGILDRMQIAEGQRVRAGQLLAVVTVPRSTLATGDTATALAARLEQRKGSLEQSEAAQASQLSAQESGCRSKLPTSSARSFNSKEK